MWWELTRLRPYLLFEDLIVHMDHESLRWLMNMTYLAGRLIRWRFRLSEFSFEIRYKKVICNSQEEVLSRLRIKGGTMEDEEAD